jgi:NAD(P)-dependent dehydrogenase (short-subunit alcohol dehydrogenase family)
VTRTDDSAVPDYLEALRLDGRRFIVIGAGQGMGRQAAHALRQAGARVLCVDKDPDLADDIAREVEGIAWTGDLTERADAERLFVDVVDPTRGLGGLDGVVDIVGMARWVELVDMSDDDWDWQFAMNIRHAYHAIQLGGRAMAGGTGGGVPGGTGGGVMVFVASVSGLTAAPFHAPYGAAKAGLMALVKSAAVELAGSGVRVNAVAPGPIATPRMLVHMSEELRAENAANVPLQRMGLPADIASALLFFASDLSAFVTGQTLVVDGGVGVKFPYPSST